MICHSLKVVFKKNLPLKVVFHQVMSRQYSRPVVNFPQEDFGAVVVVNLVLAVVTEVK